MRGGTGPDAGAGVQRVVPSMARWPMRGRTVSKWLVVTLLLGLRVPPATDPPTVTYVTFKESPRPAFLAAVRAQARRAEVLAAVSRRRSLPVGARTGPPIATARIASLSVPAGPAVSAKLPFPAVAPHLPEDAPEPMKAHEVLPHVARGPRVSIATPPIRWPARGGLTSGFGLRWREEHKGIDIAAVEGAPIYAARAGRIVVAGWFGSYGLTVVIDHGSGLQTLYAHASAVLVRPGQQVKVGQLVARVGTTGFSTGPHLHFEFRVNGHPVNPLRYL